MNKTPFNENQNQPKLSGKTIVIEKQKWDGILRHLNKNKDDELLKEKTRAHLDYLKNESKAMTTNWINSKEALIKQKAEDDLKKQKMKIEESERRYKELMKNDENAVQENLKKSQNLITRLKPNIKQLESAAVLCEVLKTREIQCSLNNDIKKSEDERRFKENNETQMQSQQTLCDQILKSNEKLIRRNEYKNDLRNFNIEKQKEQNELMAKQVASCKFERELAEKELKAQIERERAYLEKKRAIQRQNALEAMKMAEQRRKRDIIVNETENEIIACYEQGKQNLSNLQKKRQNELRENCNKIKTETAFKIYKDNSLEIKAEDERIARDIERNNQMLKERERQKCENDKKMKAARIEEHLKDVEMRKKLEAKKEEKLKFAIANRIKNTEVSLAYEQENKKNKLKVLSENRNIITQQIDERIKNAKNNYEADKEFKNSEMRKENESDDTAFFKIAKELLDDAELKGRPILPLQRVIEKYKSDNRLIPPKGIPPHLVSNIPISKDCKYCAPFKYDIDTLKSLNPCSPKINSTLTSWRSN